MISFEIVLQQTQGLHESDLYRWIATGLVHAHGAPPTLSFEPIDVARVQLIVELRRDLEVEEDTLPIVLNLLDQLYDLRRDVGLLREMLAQTPDELRTQLKHHLSKN